MSAMHAITVLCLSPSKRSLLRLALLVLRCEPGQLVTGSKAAKMARYCVVCAALTGGTASSVQQQMRSVWGCIVRRSVLTSE